MDVLIDQSEYFRKAMDRYTYFAADEQARLAYEARQKFLHDQASYIGDARREGMKIGLQEGREKGREEGMKEGREEGMKEGREEGREEGMKEGEHKKALQTAGNLLSLGLDPEKIAEATGLSWEDVKNLTPSS